VIRSPRRKTMALQIKNGEVIVRLPSFASIKTAEKFVHAKSAWVQQKLAIQTPAPLEKSYQDGELFYFFGKQYPLKLIETNQSTSITFTDNQIQFHGRLNRLSPKGIKQKLTNWYKQQANTYLQHRTVELANKTGLKPKSVEVKTYKARWGSCRITGEIQLNWKLIMAPAEVIDYVIIHELCHLKHHNHSLRFWRLVESFQPDFKQHRLWLKKHSQQLN
jgi:predicted metal-dependent hydrolase